MPSSEGKNYPTEHFKTIEGQNPWIGVSEQYKFRELTYFEVLESKSIWPGLPRELCTVQFYSLMIRRSANFTLFRNAVRRILKLQKCERAGRETRQTSMLSHPIRE